MSEGQDALAPINAPILGAKRAFHSLIAFFVPQVAAGVIVGLVSFFGSSAGQIASHHAPPAAPLMLAADVGMILGGLLVFRDARRSMPGPIKSGALVPIGWIGARTRDLWLSASVGVLLVLLYMGAVAAFPPPPGQKFGVVSELLKSGGSAVHIWAVGAVLFSPPVEEFVFRGLLFTGFSRSWGVWAASIFVTVLFVSVHLPETVHYVPAVLVQVLFSSATLVARIATRSLLPSIVLHATYNLGLVAILYVNLWMLR
jgi:membrane protease YdiL (CAAX protease family)